MLAGLLLSLALLLPIVGAMLLRVFGARVTPRVFSIIAGVVFGLAITGALLLSQEALTTIQIGGLTVLQPLVVR